MFKRCLFKIVLALTFLSFSSLVNGIAYNSKKIMLPSLNQPVDFVDFGQFYVWAIEFQKTNPSIVIAAIGKPTAPIYPPLKEAMLKYVSSIDPEKSIEYGDLQGDESSRETMAQALTVQYKTAFQKENILFTVGGRMGLAAISHVIRETQRGKKIVTTLPYYPDYKRGLDNQLVCVDTLDAPLTAESLNKTLATQDEASIGAFIFCSPNNPMGWVISSKEWLEITKILERYPTALIVLDEAYAEMSYDTLNASLVTIAPHLKHRIILLRSATKGFSASGERMGVVASWNDAYIAKMLEYQCLQLIHPPRSGQYAYANAMTSLTPQHLKMLAAHYEPQVRTMENDLKELKFNYSSLKVQGAFYVIANFKELIGKEISKATKRIYPGEKTKIEDDVDIAFHLLGEYGVAFMPLSLFGVNPKTGLMRITCSMNTEDYAKVLAALIRVRRDLDHK